MTPKEIVTEEEYDNLVELLKSEDGALRRVARIALRLVNRIPLVNAYTKPGEDAKLRRITEEEFQSMVDSYLGSPPAEFIRMRREHDSILSLLQMIHHEDGNRYFKQYAKWYEGLFGEIPNWLEPLAE